MKKLLDLYRHNNQILNDAFDKIVVGIHLKKQKFGYKSFLLCGTEPGAGTTTIAINLAISMALSGWKTVLLDCDMRKSTDYKRLNEEAEKGLSDYLMGSCELENIKYETNYELLDYISAGKSEKNPVSLLCSCKMDELLKKLNERYEYIILDVPAQSSAIDSKILGNKADGVVLIASQKECSKKQIQEAKNELLNADSNVLGIIMNKVDMTEYKYSMKNFDYFKEKKYIKKSGRK